MQSRIFTNFYIRSNEENWLDFLFFNKRTLNGLFYGGMMMYFVNTINTIPDNFIEIEDQAYKEYDELIIEGIKRRHWTSIIKFTNGCLIRTIFLGDDEDSKQSFIVITPSDRGYKSHLKDYEEFDEPPIAVVDTGIDTSLV